MWYLSRICLCSGSFLFCIVLVYIMVGPYYSRLPPPAPPIIGHIISYAILGATILGIKDCVSKGRSSLQQNTADTSQQSRETEFESASPYEAGYAYLKTNLELGRKRGLRRIAAISGLPSEIRECAEFWSEYNKREMKFFYKAFLRNNYHLCKDRDKVPQFKLRRKQHRSR